MDQNRTVGTLSDEELGRECEAILAVDPSPEYLARVRARVTSERQSGSWRLPWTLVAAGVLAVVVIVTVAVMRLEREPASALQALPAVAPPLGESAPSTASLAIVPQSTPAAPAIRPADVGRVPIPSPTRTAEPEVLISPRDAAGLRLLVVSIREGFVDSSVLEEAANAEPLKPLDEITIQPVAIEPLPRLARLEGERP